MARRYATPDDQLAAGPQDLLCGNAMRWMSVGQIVRVSPMTV
jgi:hypothetical protein